MAQQVMWLLRGGDRLLRRAALLLLSAYQLVLGGFFTGCCRFHPTCSEYSKAVFRRFSFPRAVWLTLCRLARCHPFCHGGNDDPPPARK